MDVTFASMRVFARWYATDRFPMRGTPGRTHPRPDPDAADPVHGRGRYHPFNDVAGLRRDEPGSIANRISAIAIQSIRVFVRW